MDDERRDGIAVKLPRRKNAGLKTREQNEEEPGRKDAPERDNPKPKREQAKERREKII
jgi:hypothetical protein